MKLFGTLILFAKFSETLLVVAGLGIQTTTTFYSGRQHTRFIPWGDIIDVIIAETITMVKFILS